MNIKTKQSIAFVAVVGVASLIVGLQVFADIRNSKTITDLVAMQDDLTVIKTNKLDNLKLLQEVSLGGYNVYAFENAVSATNKYTSSYYQYNMTSEIKRVDSYNASNLVTAWLNDGVDLLMLFKQSNKELGLQKILFQNGNVFTAILKYNDRLGNQIVPVISIYQIAEIDTTTYVETTCTNEGMTEYSRKANLEVLNELCPALNLNYTGTELDTISGIDNSSLIEINSEDYSIYTAEKYFEFDEKKGIITKFRTVEPDAPVNVIIPPIINGVKVQGIGSEAFYSYSDVVNVSSVVIPEGVTEIGDKAFSTATKLTNITLPSTLMTIGAGAFSGCSSLREIEIRGTVHTIGRQTFMNCDSLETVSLSGYEELIGESAFEGCRLLSNLYNRDSITNVGDFAFKGTRIKADLFDTEKTEIADSAFDN